MEGHNEIMHCPNCRKNYSISGNYSNIRIPILLKCNHSMCDICFRNETKIRREIICRRCNAVSNLTRNYKGKDNLDEFPAHYYIAGILVQEKLNMLRDQNETDLTFKIDANIIGKKKCDKCGIKEAQVTCDQCEDSFCNVCDRIVHNITTGSKKHDRKRISSIPLPIAMIDNKPITCQLHGLDLSYNCNDCKKILCSECILQSHKDHDYESIKDKHKYALEETHELLDKVQEIIPRFSYSQSKIREICSKIEMKVQISQKTSKTFENIFGSIQQCEFNNRIKLRDFFIEQINNSRKIMDELSKRINDVNEFSRIKSSLNDISIEVYKVNLNEINAALNEILTTPCFVKKEVIDCIDKYEFEKCELQKFDGIIKLNLDVFPKIELLRIDEIPSEELKEIDLAINKGELASKFRFKENKDFDNCSVISYASNKSVANKRNKNGLDIRKGFNRRCSNTVLSPNSATNSAVEICHMISPTSFYIHLVKNREVFEDLNIRCEKWAMQAHLVTDVKKDQMCLTPIFKDNGLKEWRRVQIKEIINKEKCLVRFIDYGMVDDVYINNLKVTSDEINKTLPLAFHCRLNGSFPKNTNWSCNDTKEVMDMLKSYKTKKIHLRRKMEDVFVVDIILYSEKLGSRTESLHDVLLFLKKSSLYNYQCEHSEKVIDSTTEKDEITFNHMDSDSDHINNNTSKKNYVKKNTDNTSNITNIDDLFRIEVNILKCESPDNILLSLPGRLLELNDLSKKMQDFYSNDLNLIILKEEDIKIDAVCLVFSNICNKWCRGKISNYYPDVETVNVYLFDDGIKEDFIINNVYQLKKEFLTSYSGVIKGFLAGLFPPCRKDMWPKQTCERLEELVSNKKIYMTKIGSTVNKRIPLDIYFEDCVEIDALKPSVFKWKSVREILIQEGLACIKTSFKNVLNETKDDVINEFTMNFSGISDVEEINQENINNDSKILNTNRKWLPIKRISEKIFYGKPMFVDMNAFIYIFNENDSYKSYDKIKEVLNSMLHASKPNMSRVWKKGDICSAKYFSDNAYYRGEIIEIDGDDKYSVEYIDYGNIESCIASDLREQIYLIDIPKQVHKCRLKSLNDLLKPYENDETFLRQILDYIHGTIVEKKVTVELLEYEDEHPIVNICVNGENLLNMINDEINRRRNNDQQFKLLELDKTCLSFDVMVKDIFSANEVVLLFHKNYKKFEDDYEKLIKHIQFQAKNQSKITEFQPDKVCIAYNTLLSAWHRARIYTKINPYTNLVNIYFVDVGHITEVSKDLIREIRDEWLQIPIKTYISKLSGLKDVSLSTNYQQNEFIQNLKQCFSPIKEYRAVVKDYTEGILKCGLYDPETQRSAYSHLQ